MSVKLYSTRKGELPLHDNIPTAIADLVLPGAVCKAATDENNDCVCLLQELAESGITVRLYHFFSRHKESFTIHCDNITTFRLAYFHSHNCYPHQLNKTPFLERNYNILHSPLLSTEINIAPGEKVAFVDILLPGTALPFPEQEYPVMTDFLQRQQRNLSAKLFIQNQVASSELVGWIDELLYENTSVASNVARILTHCLQAGKQKQTKTAIKLKEQDIEKIYRIAELLASTDKKYTLQELVDQHNISAYKLKKGFKQIYRHSLRRHRHEEKMRLALQLVNNGQYSIKQVAYILHYYPQNFVRAFKKRFGYTPGRQLQQQ
jgi:AraC-like DNA-binding protein